MPPPICSERDDVVTVVSAPVKCASDLVNKDVQQYSCELLKSNIICELSPMEKVAVTSLFLGNMLARCCIDTGAGRNFVSKEMLTRALKNMGQSIQVKRIESVSVRVADTSPIVCECMATIPIVIDEKQIKVEFLVLDKLLFDCILGYQFLKQNNALINVKNGSVRLQIEDGKRVNM